MKNVKVGDIIFYVIVCEALVLKVLPNSFVRSGWGDFKASGGLWTFTEAETYGWKIKGSEEDTTIIVGGQRYKLIKE